MGSIGESGSGVFVKGICVVGVECIVGDTMGACVDGPLLFEAPVCSREIFGSRFYVKLADRLVIFLWFSATL